MVPIPITKGATDVWLTNLLPDTSPNIPFGMSGDVKGGSQYQGVRNVSHKNEEKWVSQGVLVSLYVKCENLLKNY